MKPSHYFDVRVASTAAHMGPGGITMDVMARALLVIHGAAANAETSEGEKIAFASAFPRAKVGEFANPGDLIRVFVGEHEDADALAEAIETHPRISEYLAVGRVKKVPQNIESSICYARFRIATRAHSTPERRIKRLKQGDALPYLKVSSRSTNQAFSLRFDIKRRPEPASAEIEPDSYGLSVAEREFWLPEIPDERPALRKRQDRLQQQEAGSTKTEVNETTAVTEATEATESKAPGAVCPHESGSNEVDAVRSRGATMLHTAHSNAPQQAP